MDDRSQVGLELKVFGWSEEREADGGVRWDTLCIGGRLRPR
jgi:hypothetical protein